MIAWAKWARNRSCNENLKHMVHAPPPFRLPDIFTTVITPSAYAIVNSDSQSIYPGPSLQDSSPDCMLTAALGTLCWYSASTPAACRSRLRVMEYTKTSTDPQLVIMHPAKIAYVLLYAFPFRAIDHILPADSGRVSVMYTIGYSTMSAATREISRLQPLATNVPLLAPAANCRTLRNSVAPSRA